MGVEICHVLICQCFHFLFLVAFSIIKAQYLIIMHEPKANMIMRRMSFPPAHFEDKRK